MTNNPFDEEEALPLKDTSPPELLKPPGEWSGDWYEKSCVIILGDTGLGKSTLVNLCTGSDAPNGKSPEAVTKWNKIYVDNRHGPKYPKWMDTVGLNDTSDESNFLVFQRFLRTLQEGSIEFVHAIIWAFPPCVREKREINEQATQIEAILQTWGVNEKDSKKIDVWQNVILLSEKSFQEELSFQGAKAAAKKYSESSEKMQCIQMGNFGKDPNGKIKLDSQEANHVRNSIMEALGNISNPVDLNFKTMICRDCGQKDDPRLMVPRCHWKSEKKWKKPPKLYYCCEYIQYLFTKKKLVCANPQCVNPRGNRSRWSKKRCNCCWKYSNGDYNTCAVVSMIGDLDIGDSMGVKRSYEMKRKECHKLEEVDTGACCSTWSSCCL